MPVSTRTPSLQRFFFQFEPKDRVQDRPDERIWTELHARLAKGRIIHKAILAGRSFVFRQRLQLTHLDYFTASQAAATTLADNCAR